MNHVKVFSKMKQWTLIAVLSFVFLPFGSDALQITDTDSVTKVAKKASPAVVSISVKAKVPSADAFGRGEYQFEDPFDFFQNRFFDDFFSSPRPERFSQQPQESGQASGFIVTQDGHILTNSHVVSKADEITVTFDDGREFQAKVIGSDPHTDVAVLKIEAENLPFLSLGNSDALDVGQWVVAIGNPLGLQTSVTAGVVSAKGRNNLSLARIEDFIQTDAAINRGNSGGPLLNLNSEVVGMNTAIVTNMSSGGYMGIGFAIPSNIIQHVMEELIQSGKVIRGFMGVTLQQIDNDLALAFGMEKIEGALIAEVSPYSPAEESGIKQGDVIIAYNGKKVNSIATVRNAVALMKPGSTINLTILREGEIIKLPLKLGTFPEDRTMASVDKENALGIHVETLTPQLSKQLGHQGLIGVLITQVKPGSAAAFAGLQKGNLIVAVNHSQVNSKEEFYQAIGNQNSKTPLLLLVKRGEHMHFVSIKTSP